MQSTIEHTWVLKHKPERVWDYLTQSALIEQWLMKNDFLPIAGHEFQFHTGPIPKLNLDGIFYCKVLEITPPKKLSYSWRGGPGSGQVTLDTLVEWTLVATAEGTELHLTHSGFEENNFNIFSGMNEGWNKNVHKIMALLEIK